MDYFLIKTFCFTLCVVYVLGYGNETALRAALQTGYNRFSRPASPTNVTFQFSLRALQDLDITTETMRQAGYIRMDWNDPRFTWDPTQYGNVSDLVINWGWRPEFTVGNSAGDVPNFGYDDDETRIRVYSDGHVMWGIYFTVETTCEVNTANFPFDEQTCNVEVDFLMEDLGTTMLMTLIRSEVDETFYLKNGEWELTKSHIHILEWTLCCPTQLPFGVDIDMTFIRRQPYYVINILMPMILLSFCVPWAFFITTESGERLGYAVTMLLSYFVFLSVSSELIPSTSIQIPVLATYLLVVLMLCMFALISVAIQVKLYFLESEPSRLAKRVYTFLQMVLSLECFKEKRKTPVRPITTVSQMKPPLPEVEEDLGSASSFDMDLDEEITWKCISVTVDRVLFYFYNFTVFCCNMFLVIALYG